MIDVHGDQGARALKRQIDSLARKAAGPGHRLFLGLDHGVDGRDPADRFLAWREIAQLFGDRGRRLQQTRRAFAETKASHDRPLPCPGLGRNHDLQPLALPQSIIATERQKGRRSAAQIDESPAQPRIDLGHPCCGSRAKARLRRIAVALNKQMGIEAVAHDDAARLARRLVEEDLDRAAHARQPTPCSSWTAS